MTSPSWTTMPVASDSGRPPRTGAGPLPTHRPADTEFHPKGSRFTTSSPGRTPTAERSVRESIQPPEYYPTVGNVRRREGSDDQGHRPHQEIRRQDRGRRARFHGSPGNRDGLSRAARRGQINDDA